MPELKARNEMDRGSQWKLEDIFGCDTVEKADAAFEETLKEADRMAAELATLEGRVKEDPAKAIRAFFRMEQLADRLFVYAAMRHDEDAQNGFYMDKYSRARSLATRCATAASFLEPELLTLSAEELEALRRDESLSDYSAYLRNVIRQKPHTLPGEQEKLMSMAGEVLSGPADAFGMLDNVDLPMPTVKKEGGGEERLTQATYGVKLRSRDREVRRSAFEGMLSAFNGFSSTFAALYASRVKGDRFVARARKFDTCLEAALYPDAIPVSVYENLIAAVEGALPALTEYLQLRKERLGLDELHMYDLYVPMVADFDIRLSFDEAFELVQKALEPLGEDYLSVLRRAKKDGWADIYENKNKRSGAYSWGCYGCHPFILLNHTDDLSGASTLIHELGHAMHSHYSNTNQPFPKAGYSLFVAEVASTCNEVLLMRYLMREYKDDPKAMAYLCNQMLEEFRTTVFRQTMFAAFEKRVHEMAEREEALTAESMTREYYALNKRYYGGACEVDELIGAEWMRIPHFYRNFYVYKYATGFSAAVAIADRILREGESAVKDYKRFLSAGGSVEPIEALRYAGVDMSKKETVENAMRVFADTVKQMKACLES